MCDKSALRRSSRLVMKSDTDTRRTPSKLSVQSKRPGIMKKKLSSRTVSPSVKAGVLEAATQGGCNWAKSAADYVSYHDKEWGTPLYDDAKMFEFLILETFQAGLNWLLILRKREFFRGAFHDFDVDRVAQMTEDDVGQLVLNAAGIRHEGKIRAAIGNAKAVRHMRDVEGIGLCDYFWGWVDHKQLVNESGEKRSRSGLSDRIAKDLKKRGFKFVGSTVVYSHLQAVGIINDHDRSCARFHEVQRMVIPPVSTTTTTASSTAVLSGSHRTCEQGGASSQQQ